MAPPLAGAERRFEKAEDVRLSRSGKVGEINRFVPKNVSSVFLWFFEDFLVPEGGPPFRESREAGASTMGLSKGVNGYAQGSVESRLPGEAGTFR